MSAFPQRPAGILVRVSSYHRRFHVGPPPASGGGLSWSIQPSLAQAAMQNIWQEALFAGPCTIVACTLYKTNKSGLVQQTCNQSSAACLCSSSICCCLQVVHIVKDNEKSITLERELERADFEERQKRVIVFANTKRQCEHVSKHLTNLDYR